MKKYYQLLLVVLSVASLSLLLVYRHEYNRLHYILEVFNFFGNPCNYSGLITSEVVLADEDWGVHPQWIEYQEDSYLYSAFWDGNTAKTIAYSSQKTIKTERCYLWLENEKKPIFGKFKYSNINGNFDNAYIFYCESANLKEAPYAVSFASSKQRKKMKKILITHLQSHISFNVTLCAMPSLLDNEEESFNKRALLEFISYHRLIGINSFIFYQEAIPYKYQKFLKNLSNKLGYKIAFIPWNLPFALFKKSNEDVNRVIIQEDCVARSLNKSSNVLTLDLYEYIVPTKHYFLYELLAEFNTNSDSLSIPVEIYCLQETKLNRPLALQNLQPFKNTKNEVYKVFRHTSLTQNNIVNTQNLDTGFASIHKFIECTGEETPVGVEDTTILKYSTDFIRTTLVQLLIHDQI